MVNLQKNARSRSWQALVPESMSSQPEQLAFREFYELNKAGSRALDLTHLNTDR
jgi:hypothetical protein